MSLQARRSTAKNNLSRFLFPLLSLDKQRWWFISEPPSLFCYFSLRRRRWSITFSALETAPVAAKKSMSQFTKLITRSPFRLIAQKIGTHCYEWLDKYTLDNHGSYKWQAIHPPLLSKIWEQNWEQTRSTSIIYVRQEWAKMYPSTLK